MARNRVVVVGSLADVANLILDRLEDVLDGQRDLEKLIMAMSQKETEAFGRLATAVGRIPAKIDALVALSTTRLDEVNNQLAAAVAAKDALQAAFDADEELDEAKITELTDALAAAQAAMTAHEDEVAAAADAATGSVSLIEAQIDHLNPATPPVEEPPLPEEPTP